MRRRWKALVAVGAVALLAALLFLLPPRDDGLDWVRKYGGREVVRKGTVKGYPSAHWVRTEFYFDEIPEGLTARVGEFGSKWKGMSGDRIIYVNPRKKLIGFLWSQEDWLEGNWVRFKRRVGWGR